MFPGATGLKKHHLCEACSQVVRARNSAKETGAVEKMQLIIKLPEILNKLRKPQMLLYCNTWGSDTIYSFFQDELTSRIWISVKTLNQSSRLPT